MAETDRTALTEDELSQRTRLMALPAYQLPPGVREADFGQIEWILTGYRVRTDGSVWTYKETPPRPLTPTVDAHSPNPRVELYSRGKVFRYVVARLVLRAFVGPPPYGAKATLVEFADGDRANNALSNIRWVKRNGPLPAGPGRAAGYAPAVMANVRAARHAMKLTVGACAAAVGVNPSTWRRYERGGQGGRRLADRVHAYLGLEPPPLAAASPAATPSAAGEDAAALSAPPADPPTPVETWAAVPPGYPHVAACRDGVILSTQPWTAVLHPNADPSVEHYVSAVNSDGVPEKVTVAWLVLLAFAGPPPPGTVPVHRDGDAANNAASNLVWGKDPLAGPLGPMVRVVRGYRDSLPGTTRDEQVRAAAAAANVSTGVWDAAEVDPESLPPGTFLLVAATAMSNAPKAG